MVEEVDEIIRPPVVRRLLSGPLMEKVAQDTYFPLSEDASRKLARLPHDRGVRRVREAKCICSPFQVLTGNARKIRSDVSAPAIFLFPSLDRDKPSDAKGGAESGSFVSHHSRHPTHVR